jgi:hypothetical protein
MIPSQDDVIGVANIIGFAADGVEQSDNAGKLKMLKLNNLLAQSAEALTEYVTSCSRC